MVLSLSSQFPGDQLLSIAEKVDTRAHNIRFLSITKFLSPAQRCVSFQLLFSFAVLASSSFSLGTLCHHWLDWHWNLLYSAKGITS